jgi:hypothetical protein
MVASQSLTRDYRGTSTGHLSPRHNDAKTEDSNVVTSSEITEAKHFQAKQAGSVPFAALASVIGVPGPRDVAPRPA